MTGPLSRTTPIVRSRTAAGHAFLLARIQTNEGWKARIMWAEHYLDAPRDYRVQLAEVDYSDLTQLPAQHYADVPIEHRQK